MPKLSTHVTSAVRNGVIHDLTCGARPGLCATALQRPALRELFFRQAWKTSAGEHLRKRYERGFGFGIYNLIEVSGSTHRIDPGSFENVLTARQFRLGELGTADLRRSRAGAMNVLGQALARSARSGRRSVSIHVSAALATICDDAFIY